MKRTAKLWVTVLALLVAGVDLFAQVQQPQAAKAPQDAAKTQPSSPAEDENGSPIQLDHRTLVVIAAPLAGHSAADRAAEIQQRLLDFARDRKRPVSDITVNDQPYWSQIKTGPDILMWVSQDDGKAAGLSVSELAGQNAEIFRNGVVRFRSEHTLHNFLFGLFRTIVATAVMLLALVVLSRVYRWIRGKVRQKIESSSEKFADRPKARLVVVSVGPPILGLFAISRWIIVLLLLDAYLALVLGFFPATRVASQSLSGWFSSHLSAMSEQIVDYLPNLFIVIVIVLATYYVVKLSGFFFGQLSAGQIQIEGFYSDWAGPTSKLVRGLILVLAAIIVFPYLPGSKSPAFQGVSIFLGILLSLGSSSAVANAVAGTILTYMRSFQVGDYVQLGETRGEIVAKNLLVTRILTPKKEIVTIPNGAVMSGSVTNYSAEAALGGVVLHTTVTIGYDAPWKHIHELLISAALSTHDVLKEPSPFVYQTSLDDFYVSYELNVFTNQPRRMPAIYSELHQNIQDRFNEAGVEIMSPHYAQLRDGNQTTTPAPYLPPDYKPSSFQVQVNEQG